MSWFQLDPESVAARVRASGRSPAVPSFAVSLRRGIVGFTLLSVAGFVPWAVFGKWFHRNLGEAGLYLVCAVTFIGLSGPLLHQLIIGPGSLARFYKLFGVTFAVNSVLWIGGWFALRTYGNGHAGSLAGLFAGTTAMGWLLTLAFDARGAALRVISALFVLNSLGYFVGGWIEGAVVGAKQLSLLGTALPKSAKIQLLTRQYQNCLGS